MRYRPGKLKQIIDNVSFTNGKEWMDIHGNEHVGPIFYIGERVYPGIPEQFSIARLPRALVQYVASADYVTYIKLRSRSYLLNRAPIAVKPIPTESDYSRTWMYRYFCRKRNDLKSPIIEIDEKQFTKMAIDKVAINPILYTAIKLQWTIRGPVADIYVGDMISIPSVFNMNAATLRTAESNFPGISIKLYNLIEYAQVTAV